MAGQIKARVFAILPTELLNSGLSPRLILLVLLYFGILLPLFSDNIQDEKNLSIHGPPASDICYSFHPKTHDLTS